MDTAVCFEKGLLRREKPDPAKADKSLEIARHKLTLVKKLMSSGIYEEAVTMAYAAMFHAARALLFRDGVAEKSHFAVYVYVSEIYGQKLEKRLIHQFNELRVDRHAINYGLDILPIDCEDAGATFAAAKEFVDAVTKLCK